MVHIHTITHGATQTRMQENCQTANNLIEGTYEIFILDNDGCEGNLLINIDNIDGPIAIFNQNFDTVTYVDGIVDFINFSSAAAQTELIETNGVSVMVNFLI